MTTSRLTIGAVNALDRAAFVARFAGIYEKSSWVAEEAWQARPFADTAALESAMRGVVERADRERKLELLCNHPRLGTRLQLTGYSRAEQAGAGLMDLGADERAELELLNRRYEEQFGFPFILAVRNATARTILDSARTRINHDEASEFDESLRQVFRIAHFRLSDLLDNGSSATR